MPPTWAMELFVAAIGGTIAGVSLFNLFRNHAFHKRAIPGDALVTGRTRHWESSSSGNSGGHYYYVIEVEFVSRQGATVRTPIRLGNIRVPKPGRRVRILYDPEAPDDAQVDSLTGRGGCELVFATLFASAFFVGGLVALVRTLSG